MLNFNFSYNQQETLCTFDLVLNLQKQRQYLRFEDFVDDNGVNLAYVSMPKLDSSALSIVEENIYNSNTELALEALTVFEVKTAFLPYTFYTKNQVFDLTHVYTLSGEVKKPLWYKHVLPEGSTGIKIFNKYGDLISPSDYVIQNNIVYHNLQNNYDNSNLSYEAYFITYNVNSQTYNVVVKNSPIFEKRFDSFATPIESFDEPIYTINTSNLNTGSFKVQVYYKPNASASSYNLFVRPSSYGQLRPYLDSYLPKTENWFFKVSAGSIINGTNSYYLPEFYNKQLFYANNKKDRVREAPKTNNLNEAYYLSTNLVMSKWRPIFIDAISSLDVIVLDKTGAPKDGFTTNTDGKLWRSPETGRSIYLRDVSLINEFSYDPVSGLIHLPYSILDTDIVLIDCKYQENFYTYKGINLNPVMRPDLLGKLVYFYLKPKPVTSHLLRFIPTVQDVEDSLAYAVFYQDGTLYESSDSDFEYNLTSFIEDETLFKVCKIFVNAVSNPSQLELIDTRSLGGGIKEDVDINEVLRLYPEVSWYNNIGGKPIPLMNSVFLDLPITIKEGYGGDLTDNLIQRISHKHLPLGNFIYFSYYGKSPNIYSAYVLNGNLYLNWNYELSADKFYIYALSNNGDKILLGTTTGNSIQINGPFGAEYLLITVTAEKDYQEGASSEVIKVKC